MMTETRAQISEGGRLVIPAAFRRALHLELGQEVMLSLTDDEIRISPLHSVIKRAQKTVQKYNPKHDSLSDELISMRREESGAI